MIKYIVRKKGSIILEEKEQKKYINSGNNIESLSIINYIHGVCASTRTKLSVVPESIDILKERNNWEEWQSFIITVKRSKSNSVIIIIIIIIIISVIILHYYQ